ncbi:MAG TPA: hypothetical protein VKT33_02090 [Candidatus Angelobacter sp.]|nr:hypothetical protein [Candidatus Angelobacter sp.]
MMRKQTQIAALVLAASLVAAQAVRAQTPESRVSHSGNEWIEETSGTLAAARTVKVRIPAGSIKVAGGDQTNVTWVVRKRVSAQSEEAARRELARFHASASSSRDAVIFNAESSASRVHADYELHVPRHTDFLRLETNGGPVMAVNITGRVEARTGGGAIQIDQIGGLVVARSGGGDIDIGRTGGDVRLATGGGHIRVMQAAGNVKATSGGGDLSIGSGKLMELDTGGGDIKVSQCSGEIKASTGGGNLELVDIGGTAQLETGSGTIHIGPVHGGLHAETGAGNIVADLTGSKNAFSASRLETSAGNIVVYLPDGLGVTIRASVEVARGSGIHSDLSGLRITEEGTRPGPREVYAEGSLNGGGPLLHVHTVSGNIEFKRKSDK